MIGVGVRSDHQRAYRQRSPELCSPCYTSAFRYLLCCCVQPPFVMFLLLLLLLRPRHAPPTDRLACMASDTTCILKDACFDVEMRRDVKLPTRTQMPQLCSTSDSQKALCRLTPSIGRASCCFIFYLVWLFEAECSREAWRARPLSNYEHAVISVIIKFLCKIIAHSDA